MARLTVNDMDRRIAERRLLLDRTTTRLVELDADVTRQLLESSTSLRGRTRTEWTDASRRHADLWRGQFALEGVLSRIADLRGTRRHLTREELQRVDGLLEGSNVEMACTAEESRPRLTDTSSPVVLTTMEDALQQMSSDYEIVADLVARVADVWGGTAERLHELDRQLASLEEQAGASGFGLRLPNEFAAVGRAVADAVVLVRDDPLAVDAGSVSALGERVQHLASVLEGTRAEQAQRLADLAAVEETVREGKHAIVAFGDQLQRWSQKVVVRADTWRALDGLGRKFDEVARESERVRLLGSADGAGALRTRSESLLDELRRMAATEGGRLAERDELRGILDAYRAKAQALGQAEDLELDNVFVQAREALYSAPCDLDDARQLVEAYRHAVRPSREGMS